jgi:hypothetical protein
LLAFSAIKVAASCTFPSTLFIKSYGIFAPIASTSFLILFSFFSKIFKAHSLSAGETLKS